MPESLEDWAASEVMKLLEHSLGRAEVVQLVTYAVSIDNKDDSANYFQDLLGSSTEALEFTARFIDRRFPPLRAVGAWSSSVAAARKENQQLLEQQQQQQQQLLLDEAKEAKLQQERMAESDSRLLYSQSEESVQNLGQQPDGNGPNGGYKAIKTSNRQKRKQVKERAAMEQVGTQPPGKGGRPVCECMAAVHGLVSNCLACGKIVCLFEGEGPCSTCGNMVQARRQQHQLAADDDPSVAQGLQQEADGTTKGSDLHEAQMRIDRLLKFDSNSESRTKVHDTASDFDLSSDVNNKWLTPEERGLALKREQEIQRVQEEQRRRRVMTIDIVNRQVILEKEPDARSIGLSNIAKSVETSTASSKMSNIESSGPDAEPHAVIGSSSGVFHNPNLRAPPPRFLARQKPNLCKAPHAATRTRKTNISQQELLRLQDDLYQEDIDEATFSSADLDEPSCVSNSRR
ncbi:hypothetical protein BASA61_000200 [Batrachochytrium salamandrivorans]|nr:hypothetical protein BASA61_000200 [Batrachochytrium salamandrivorans]